MQPAQILAELDDVIRTMPPQDELQAQVPNNLAWLGRAAAVLELWKPSTSLKWGSAVIRLHGLNGYESQSATSEIIALIHQARASLQMQVNGPLSTVTGAGAVFDYFDEIRRIIEQAAKDILFVDPYLDAEFVSRYLPHVRAGVAVRLLARERMSSLMSAVKPFAAQSGLTIEARSAPGFHDRFVFIDRAECYQSGASFKDGAKKAPVTVTQITDAFAPMLSTYEALWTGGTVQT